MTPFPPSTSITVGAGFITAGLLPGYPENPNSPVLAADFENRNLIGIKFDEDLTIGGFAAHDYFGDGSFYLLDSPGHCAGHISALARTTSSSVDEDDTFIFLGGDICHFAGDFRPSHDKPLPQSLPDGFSNRRKIQIQCPCSLISRHPNATNEADAGITPWYKIASELPTAYHDFELARSSVLKMQALDQDDNVLSGLSRSRCDSS